jgi:hypothetical protein
VNQLAFVASVSRAEAHRLSACAPFERIRTQSIRATERMESRLQAAFPTGTGQLHRLRAEADEAEAPCNGRIDSPCPARRCCQRQADRGGEMESDVEH